MTREEDLAQVAKLISQKGNLKFDIYDNTLSAMKKLKETAKEVIEQLQANVNGRHPIPLEYRERSEFEFEIKFAGDVLIFIMHSNIFEFSRYHEIMNTPYIKQDKERSYSGIISIYNFLSDSFKYNRMNDAGYMIGRMFINKDNHFYLEGKREIAMIYNDYSSSKFEESSSHEIIRAAILYTVNFDLLTPPYDSVKIVSVADMQEWMNNLRVKTGKRLGFQFKADEK